MSNIGKSIEDSYACKDGWPYDGSFKTTSGFYASSWGTCRDVFHSEFNVKRHKYFYWAAYNYRKQAKFIELLEDLFNIKSEYRTRINPIKDCGRTPIVKITLSPFWLADNIRVCFLTVVLKATLDEDGRASRSLLIRCLKECEYSEQTERAIALFLSGRTVLNEAAFKNDNERNWVYQFKHSEQTHLSFPRAYRFHRRRRVKSNLTAREKSELSRWVNYEEDGYDRKFKFTFDKSC